MNRKNVCKVIRGFANIEADADFNLLAVIHSVFPNDGYRGVAVTLGLSYGVADRMVCNSGAGDRHASAWMVSHLLATGDIDWPLAVARAGLTERVAA